MGKTEHVRNTTVESAFDLRAAVTRSLLGWGVVVGPSHLLVAVATRC